MRGNIRSPKLANKKIFPVWCFVFFLVYFCFGGCAILGFKVSTRYDDRSFSIVNLNLFNQRVPSSMSQKNWKGDWLFRRERLEFVDEQLKVSRPDVVVFQELLIRRGSPSESDINILSHGALEGYEWDADVVTKYNDTQEEEYHSAAVGLPIKLANIDPQNKKIWAIGLDGSMTYSVLELDQKPFLLVNLSMPSSSQKVDHWYRFVRDEIEKMIKRFGLCRQRLILSGYIPGGMVWEGFAQLLRDLELKDASQGFCEAAIDCFTTNNQNDLFMASSQGQSPSHSERILLHQNAIVSYSSVVMSKMKDKPSYIEGYGLQRFWASRSYGWLSVVRLQECPSESY